jgi:hypothetical protein
VETNVHSWIALKPRIQLTGAVGAAVIDDDQFHLTRILDVEDLLDSSGEC